MTYCPSVDSVFRYPGYVPGLSSVTGLFRIVIGVVELIAGTLLTTLGCHSNYALRIIEGGKNITRGTVETIPILGNIALIAYDCFC